ncbi:MAG: response regulator [Candidatus Solibacter usitatus]|nr:response regulator [Candidatus Solibacter usitatus]
MPRVLLADDSPHAQRMGERILREEGFEVVSVTDGDAAMQRLADSDPDVMVVDAFLPRRSGFDLCREVKSNAGMRHVQVVLTAGVLELLDETEAMRAGSDALLKKPFEASAMMDTLQPLVEAARMAREQAARGTGPAARFDLEDERVRAAVTLAVDASMPTLVDEITRQVLSALKK